jgi:GNAT superfamily N-acetyltransferase
MRWAIWTKAGATFDNALMGAERTVGSHGEAMEIRVRDLGPDEADVVRDLVIAGLTERWGAVDPTLNADLADLAGAYPGSRTVVATAHGGTIVGTGTVTPRSTAEAEVLRMSVARHVRGTGVGRQILDELVDIARAWGAHRVVLETTATWSDAVAFYERCGFRRTHYAEGAFGCDLWFERLLGDASARSGDASA